MEGEGEREGERERGREGSASLFRRNKDCNSSSISRAASGPQPLQERERERDSNPSNPRRQPKMTTPPNKDDNSRTQPPTPPNQDNPSSRIGQRCWTQAGSYPPKSSQRIALNAPAFQYLPTDFQYAGAIKCSFEKPGPRAPKAYRRLYRRHNKSIFSPLPYEHVNTCHARLQG
jgi:hypothetical protein